MEQRRHSFSGLLAQLEGRKKKDIQRWQSELDQCRAELTTLKKQIAEAATHLQLVHLQNRLHVEEKRKTILQEKLRSAGVQVEKRGRPKKDPSVAYKQTRVKFTALLRPENLLYLKFLKSNGSIHDISGFLDQLVEEYRNNME